MPGQIRPAGRIGSKSMEIKAQIGLKFMDLLPIRPGMKYCSNWVEIHGFSPNSTGHKLLVKLGGNSLRLQYRLMKNKNKVTQYI